MFSGMILHEDALDSNPDQRDRVNMPSLFSDFITIYESSKVVVPCQLDFLKLCI